MPINRETIIGETVVSGNTGRTFNHFEGFTTENHDGSRTLRIRFDEVDIVVFSDGSSYTRQRGAPLEVSLTPDTRSFNLYNLRTGNTTGQVRTYGNINQWLQSLYLDAVATQP